MFEYFLIISSKFQENNLNRFRQIGLEHFKNLTLYNKLFPFKANCKAIFLYNLQLQNSVQLETDSSITCVSRKLLRKL